MRPDVEIARSVWAVEDIADHELAEILGDVQVRFADRTSIIDPAHQAVCLFAVAAAELLRLDRGPRDAAMEAFDRVVATELVRSLMAAIAKGA